uniref:ER lumen protein-retaining receptor n=1 Tax=Dermatophagoides pteronyssinus TaxID=6956 RepID=A0A6P6XXZ3_DERPT|nr:ER lumen protein-retaining receptor-like [Dermatophagoides pteronyssinus]
MNIFRLCGDMLHLLSILMLIYKLRSSRNCSGISSKMQELYALVFLTRYVDLLYYHISFYNTVMKLTFIGTSLYIVYLLRLQQPISKTYDAQADDFPYARFLIAPAAALALLPFGRYRAHTLLWRFSILLEAVAILPQLRLLQRYRVVENLTSHYVATMGLYRLLYILNWVYRYKYEGFVNYFGVVGGVVQVALYLDFFYYYFQARINGVKLILPYANHV